MEKEVLARFLNKTIKLTLTSGYLYRGELKEITDQSCCLQDVRQGELWLSLSIIAAVEPWSVA